MKATGGESRRGPNATSLLRTSSQIEKRNGWRRSGATMNAGTSARTPSDPTPVRFAIPNRIPYRIVGRNRSESPNQNQRKNQNQSHNQSQRENHSPLHR